MQVPFSAGSDEAQKPIHSFEFGIDLMGVAHYHVDTLEPDGTFEHNCVKHIAEQWVCTCGKPRCFHLALLQVLGIFVTIKAEERKDQK